MTRTRSQTLLAVILGVLTAVLALTACANVEPPSTEPATNANSGEAVPGTSSPDGEAATTTGGPAPEPAAPGRTLSALSTPPARSLWALSADSYDADVEIEVEFQPYGTGPSSFGPSIVALVTVSSHQGSEQRVPELDGRNVVFIVGDTTVKVGGHYAGTAVTRLQDDRIVFVLKQASLLPE
jgi:hypothetical protein